MNRTSAPRFRFCAVDSRRRTGNGARKPVLGASERPTGRRAADPGALLPTVAVPGAFLATAADPGALLPTVAVPGALLATAAVRSALLAAAVVTATVLAGCASDVAAPPPSSSPGSPSPSAAPTATGPSIVVSPASPADPSAVGSVPPSTLPDTAVTAPAPGTGSAADRIAAETAFRTYLHAVAAGDFATACSLNAPETNQRLIDEVTRRGTPVAGCEQAIATLYAGSGVARGAATIANTLSVQRVDVAGDAATVAWSVEVSGQRPVVTNALRRIDGRWRLLPTSDPAG